MDESNQLAKSYDYDAFGVEKSPSDEDSNPFRYCGEYYDVETETYYLRARYYDPRIGRFTQQDTHWNTSDKIYGDNPQKINEREDKLGLKTYSYAPQIIAVVQSGNMYVYAVGNPVMYADEDGEIAKLVKAAIHGAINGIIAAMTSDAENTTDYVVDIAIAFGSGFVSDYVGAFETFLMSSVIELSIGMFRKEITFDNFNDALFNTLSSGLINYGIGEWTESIFSIFTNFDYDFSSDIYSNFDSDSLKLLTKFFEETFGTIISEDLNDSKNK